MEGDYVMNYASPYTPGAGAMPPYLAGRDEIVSKADKYLLAMAKGYPGRHVVYYGLRGVGKTVLLNVIEKRADELNILYEHIEIFEKRSFIRKITEDQSFSAGLSEPSSYVMTGSLSDDLTDMFVAMGKCAEKANRVICFFIDEIQYMKDDEMEALISALHRVNQLRLPIMIFGAGLPKILRIFGEVKSYTERLFVFEEIAELPEAAAREAIIKPAEDFGVQYEENAVKEILKWTKGYPYFIQEFCNIIWEYTEKDIIEKSDIEHVTSTFLERKGVMIK